MRKSRTFDRADCEPRKGSRMTQKLILLVAFLLVSPLFYEWGNLTYGRWQSVLGKSYRVETPVLDTIARHGSELRLQFGGLGTNTFRKFEWKPMTIVPITIGFAGIAGWFLRRGI